MATLGLGVGKGFLTAAWWMKGPLYGQRTRNLLQHAQLIFRPRWRHFSPSLPFSYSFSFYARFFGRRAP